jgi:hypothetical protein
MRVVTVWVTIYPTVWAHDAVRIEKCAVEGAGQTGSNLGRVTQNKINVAKQIDSGQIFTGHRLFARISVDTCHPPPAWPNR